MRVGDLMEREFVLLAPDEDLAAAAAKLARGRAHGAPVVDAGGRVVGLLRLADILGALRVVDRRFRILLPPEVPYGIGFAQELRERAAAVAFGDLTRLPVARHMHPVATVGPTASLEEALRLMVEGGIEPLPVVEGGRLLGLLSPGAILGAVALEAAGGLPPAP